jgi:hypothetical protein
VAQGPFVKPEMFVIVNSPFEGCPLRLTNGFITCCLALVMETAEEEEAAHFNGTQNYPIRVENSNRPCC